MSDTDTQSGLTLETKKYLVVRRVNILMRLAQKHGMKCWYCQAKLTFKQMEIDHIIPKVQGGPDKDSNLAIACKSCNRAKWDLGLPEFLHWLLKPKKPIAEIIERTKRPQEHWLRYADDIAKGFRK